MRPELPPIRGMADIELLEQVPLEQRIDVWTIYELVKRGAGIDPDKAAFHCIERGSPQETPRTISYRQLVARVHQAANLFHSLGVGSGDAVAILLPIVPQNYFALLGATTAGIACPINWMLHAEQIAALLNATGARVLVALGPTPGFDIWEKIPELRERVPGLRHILQVKIPGGASEAGSDFDALSSDQSAERLTFERSIDREDVAIYVHTGGTTGTPKIARVLHRSVAYKCWAYSVLLAQEPCHTTFAGSPLFHIGGIVHRTLGSLACGMSSVVLGPMGFRTRDVVKNYWKLVERYKVTELGGVPTTLGALSNVPPDADISSLRPYAMCGSAGLPARVSKYFAEQVGVRILSNYGMTENTATICLPPRDGEVRFGSSGIRFPYTKVRTVIVDGDGRIERDCNADEIGEIIISGPGVIPGYLDESLNVKLFLAGGWLRTGDLGRLDPDGYLWVTGRAKDLIIRGGHNIDPQLIEETLMAHESVALAAAVGKPDAYAGELPVAFVQLKPGAKVEAEDLKNFARSRIAERAAAPVEVFLVDPMPLTDVGKIFKPELRKRAGWQAYFEVVRPIAPAASEPEIDIVSDPVRGTLVVLTLSPTEETRDRAAERALRSALDGFTCAYRIAWRQPGQRLPRNIP
jgi:fatty-acyl-CoA synthase